MISFRNASGLYPFKGIYFFFAHLYLYPLLRARLIPCVLLSLFVLTNLFLWTYLPQVAFLAIFNGALAWVSGVFLVLGEGAAIIALLFEAFFVDETLVDIFDAVLIDQGYEDLVAQGRVIHPETNEDGTKRNPVERLGQLSGPKVYSPFLLIQILEFIFLLPLNFIPIAGTPAFLILTGARAGPLQHWRYHKLLGLNKKERKGEAKKMRLPYTWFGAMALTLQLVPVLSMLFLMTTATGSAMWVANLEQRRRILLGEGSNGLVSGHPVPYHDDAS
ncbi:hypothetical protein MMC25_001387 [Agyrium rufum]|nr:hypothetical protein [Agyrium rufum]